MALLPAEVIRIERQPAVAGKRIVHLGLGAFHRAHQAVYTDEAVGAASGVSASTLSRFERGLTASRLVTRRVGGPEVSRDDRDVVLDSEALAVALGFSDAAALRRACVDAYRAALDPTSASS